MFYDICQMFVNDVSKDENTEPIPEVIEVVEQPIQVVEQPIVAVPKT